MAVREYIGARYIPIFSDPLQWDPTKKYEPLTVVTDQGASYVSRQYVPEGIQLDNTDYWVLWADFNAQLQHYIDEVNAFDGRIDTLEGKFPVATSDIADDAITGDKIDDGAIGTAALADDAVTAAKIDDGAIGTAALADSAVTTAKLADSAVSAAKMKASLIEQIRIGSHFIKPQYVGSFTNYSGMYMELNTNDDHPIFAQSMTMADDDEFKFFVVNKDSDNAHVVTANTDTNTVAESATNHTGWGHCNDACYNPVNERYYICRASDSITTDTILITDSSFNEITRISVPNAFYYAVMLYDKATGEMYAVCGTDVYSFDPSDNSFTALSTLSEAISAGSVALQGGSIYNGIAVFPVASNSPNIAALKVFDIETGQKLQTITLAEDCGYYPTGELEDCEFDTNGNLYISSIQCYDTGQRYYSLTVLTKCNLFEGMLNTYFPQYSTQPRNVYVECANYTGFRSTGTEGYPCKSLEEASAMVCVLPKIRMVKIGVDSNYSSNTPQTWFGWLQLTGVMCTIHWHASAITIRGGIIVRDNAIIKMRNAARFKPTYGQTGTSMVRIDDSIMLAGSIYSTADSGADSTYSAVVYCTATGLFIAQTVTNNVGATNAVSNFNAGFGYVLAPIKSGSW